ncbi:alpha/beta fold hydrolase [Phaeocystidibacter luteus]|uniref:Alpha/beta hydrolase n=1 Tax=Phaeocystidibacter luteus TaxID=911197 RepID=A0A6N6RJV4_9FLAO|nr:alpha/beta hydrolase [Phaeocystidibacter luteus]KAB2814000.1 alpha/beta hydrolase [Phaeocystidibacter luteus]
MNPIVLLHGALGAGSQLEPIAREIRQQTSREVFAYECPGHGGQDVPEEGFEMGTLAAHFGKWLGENNILGADVFGYSMGGYIALLTVRTHPERIRHILTLGTKFDWSVEGAKREMRYLDPALLEEKVPKYAAHLQSLHGGAWKDVLSATSQLMTTLGANPLLNEHNLQFIQHPVVITRGSEDKMVSREESESVSLSLVDARYEEIEGWEHPLEKLEPEAVSRLVTRVFGR